MRAAGLAYVQAEFITQADLELELELELEVGAWH
jgi:hypothetical protein